MKTFNDPLIHKMDKQTISEKFSIPTFLGIIVIFALVGVIVGYGLTYAMPASSSTTSAKGNPNAAKQAGIADKSTFKDQAQGIMKEGGLDGEGNFHLERPGGASQNVYLTSSTVDLSEYIGQKVKVWGETFQSDKAGWFMDVGYVEKM